MKLRRISQGRNGPDVVQLAFYCPGCDCAHSFRIKGPEPVWNWNGDMELPTFSPSLVVNQHDVKKRCHLFVREGNIQFLSDCHHASKGQTVPIPDWPDWD